MDLSKAFDTLNHDLLIAKLHAYSFSEESLKLIKITRQIVGKEQRPISVSAVDLSCSHGYHKDLSSDFYSSIYILMTYFISLNRQMFATMPNNTTFHACDSDLGNLIIRFEHDSMLAIEWFESNYMKLNED